MNTPIIAITTGEPAGIGPDLVLTLHPSDDTRYVLIGDRDMLAQRARQQGLIVNLQDYQPNQPASSALEICHVPLAESAEPGVLNPANAHYVLDTLDRAVDGCLSGEFSAMVTAPVHKGIINDAGMPFSGHTEYLAERTGTKRVVMMLAGGNMRVALVTTHLPLTKVPAAITTGTLHDTLRVLLRALQHDFGIARPRILVAGLNPHAGEGGHLGCEEIEVITPVLDALRTEGHLLIGPLPADTLFNPGRLAEADAVLAMYHDQGLPVLKYASFGHGVNITLGLPIIRTSVDHGTALELAGSGKADPGSLQTALALAREMAQSRSGDRPPACS